MADTAVAAAERTLPHNLEAERSVLGAILFTTTPSTSPRRSSTPRDFFRDAHRRIFDQMVALTERSQPIDLVTLKEELERGGDLEEVGGPAYVASLVDGVPRSTNVEYYAQIVKEKATLRNLIFAANKILDERLRGRSGSRPDPRRGRERDLRRRRRPHQGRASCRCASSSARASRRSSSCSSTRRFITGVPTGFVDLDADDARPAGAATCHRRGAPVDGQDQPRAQHLPARRDARRRRSGFFSLEMSKESLFMRMLARKRRSTSTG